MADNPLAQLLSVVRSMADTEERLFVEPVEQYVPLNDSVVLWVRCRRPDELQKELDWIREQSKARFNELREPCIKAGIAAGFQWKAEERVNRLVNAARSLMAWEDHPSVQSDCCPSNEFGHGHLSCLLKRVRDALPAVAEMAAAVPDESPVEPHSPRVTSPGDDAYVLAKPLWTERFPDYKTFKRAFDKIPDATIRRRKPSPQRLEIHAGDWTRYWESKDAERFELMDDAAIANAVAEERKNRRK